MWLLLGMEGCRRNMFCSAHCSFCPCKLQAGIDPILSASLPLSPIPKFSSLTTEIIYKSSPERSSSYTLGMFFTVLFHSNPSWALTLFSCRLQWKQNPWEHWQCAALGGLVVTGYNCWCKYITLSFFCHFLGLDKKEEGQFPFWSWLECQMGLQNQ